MLGLIFAPSSVFAYTASLSTSGTVNLNVSASGNGANVTSDSLSIISTCPSGYNVSIEGPTDSTLYKNGNSSNNSATQKILASSGTRNNPLPIIGSSGSTSYVKTWGYSTGDYNSSTGTYDPATVNSNFIGLTSTITNIFSSNTATTSTGTILPVYYGASVDSTIEPGLYTMAESTSGANDNKITYYLTTSLSCTSYTVNFNPTSTAGGQTISGTGTMNPQTISEGTATALNQNTYTAPSGYEFKEWNTSQDGTGTSYQDAQQVTDIAQVGSSITLYAQWQKLFVCSAGKICYNDNGANSPTTMGDQTAPEEIDINSWNTECFMEGGYSDGASQPTCYDSSTDEEIDIPYTYKTAATTLWASNYQYANYGFAGWNTKADGTGTQYGPNETIDDSTTLATIQSTGLKLYAKWIASQGNLQDWQGCSSMSNGDVTALKDTRDNQVYAIAKLADGKCWMIENLRLNTSGSNDESKSQGFGGVFAGLANPETANFTNSANANSLYYSGTQSGTATIDIGTTDDPGYRFPRFNNQNSASPVSNMTSTNSNVYSYGNHYTWSAALANTNNYTGPTDTVGRRTSETVNTSLCPSGWRLPYGRNTGNGNIPGGFYYLNYKINNDQNIIDATASNKLRAYPNNFIFSGSLNGSVFLYRGSSGPYWTSTSTNYSSSYYLSFSSAAVGPGTQSDNKGIARPVRCVVKDPPKTLYEEVASRSKGTQTAAELQAVITKPTSSDPLTDTSNSGVYEYNSNVFGTSSDASNDYKIYYYRGILDNNLSGTSGYGSKGDGTLYPNYVKLGNTCWRIVRTTGSGGVKMIYNGLYSGGTTANSCANATTDAEITTQAFGKKGNSAQSTYWYRNINRVGYTFNNDSSIQDSTTDTSVDTVFGSNSNYSSTNTEDSNIKDYIENTWFSSANGISAYESLLESSAGYCNDRTAYSNDTTSTSLSTIPPYATSSATMYFGAYGRNANATNAGKTPSLTCPSSRNTVDLYTTSSATNGNKQLSKPVALLTADELSFAGSGSSTATNGSVYNSNSFIRSGSSFWLLSPYHRYSTGYANEFILDSNGILKNTGVTTAPGVRPSISLKPGATIADGTGTALDPWVINPASQTPTLNISANDITVGESANISISASSSATGNVVINIYQINGSDNPLIKTETKELVGGSTGLTVSGLGVGQYRVQVLYPGDIVYIPAEANKYFRVEDSLIPPIID